MFRGNRRGQCIVSLLPWREQPQGGYLRNRRKGCNCNNRWSNCECTFYDATSKWTNTDSRIFRPPRIRRRMVFDSDSRCTRRGTDIDRRIPYPSAFGAWRNDGRNSNLYSVQGKKVVVVVIIS